MLPEAVVRVVTGQMFLGKAADIIYGRARIAAEAQRFSGSWLLDLQTLRECGLSGAKANAIIEFGLRIGDNSTALDYWYGLPLEVLVREIKSFRGMGSCRLVFWHFSILIMRTFTRRGTGVLSVQFDLLPRMRRKATDEDSMCPE